jgi:hypothetical protein
VEFEDAIYHLCTRGNARQRIFWDDRDRIRFLELLEESRRRFDAAEFGENLASLSSQKADLNHQFQFEKRSQLFIRVRFPSSRCASATKIVFPLESTVATQPQLQPALLRLSAMISQYFTQFGCG